MPVQHHINVVEQACSNHVHLAGSTLLSGRPIQPDGARSTRGSQPILHSNCCGYGGRAEQMMAAGVPAAAFLPDLPEGCSRLGQARKGVKLGQNADDRLPSNSGAPARRASSSSPLVSVWAAGGVSSETGSAGSCLEQAVSDMSPTVSDIKRTYFIALSRSGTSPVVFDCDDLVPRLAPVFKERSWWWSNAGKEEVYIGDQPGRWLLPVARRDLLRYPG